MPPAKSPSTIMGCTLARSCLVRNGHACHFVLGKLLCHQCGVWTWAKQRSLWDLLYSAARWASIFNECFSALLSCTTFLWRASRPFANKLPDKRCVWCAVSSGVTGNNNSFYSQLDEIKKNIQTKMMTQWLSPLISLCKLFTRVPQLLQICSYLCLRANLLCGLPIVCGWKGLILILLTEHLTDSSCLQIAFRVVCFRSSCSLCPPGSRQQLCGHGCSSLAWQMALEMPSSSMTDSIFTRGNGQSCWVK